MRAECWYTTCTEPSSITQFTRSSASTSSELVRYNTTIVSGVTTRSSSSMRSNDGRYSVTNHDCYILAIAAGRENSSSLFGVPAISPIFFSESEQMMITFCQAFYNNEGTALGVFGIETHLEFLSYQLAGLISSDRDDMAVVEKYGEVVASSQFELRCPSSSGGEFKVLLCVRITAYYHCCVGDPCTCNECWCYCVLGCRNIKGQYHHQRSRQHSGTVSCPAEEEWRLYPGAELFRIPFHIRREDRADGILAVSLLRTVDETLRMDFCGRD